MSTMMPPLPGAPPQAPRLPREAARTGAAEGRRDDPFLATLRSALGTRDGHDTRSAAEHDRLDGGTDGDTDDGTDSDERPVPNDPAPESPPSPHPLDPPVTNGVPEETAGDPSPTAAEDTAAPAVDPRPLGTPEWAEGRSEPPGLDPLHTPHPDTPAATGPPGLDPLHTPHPDTPVATGPPGLDPLHTPHPDTPAATRLEQAEAGAPAGQESPVSPPRDPSTVESAVEAAATTDGGGATTVGATTDGASPAAGAPSATGTSPGQGPDGASDPSPDTPSGTGPPAADRPGAGPGGSTTTATPPGSERPAASTATPPSTAPPTTPAADHLVRLTELVDAARATVRRSGPSSVRVQLHPAELGTVEVEVRLDDDGLQMVLRAERHHGAERLAANLDQLRRGLEREGLQLTDIEVSVGTSDRDTDLRGDTTPRDADDDPAWSDGDTVDRTDPSTGARRRASVTHRSEHRLTIEL